MGSDDFLEYAFDNTETGVAIVGIDGAIVRANGAGAALIGRVPDAVIGDPFMDFVHPDDLDYAVRELGSTVVEGHGGPADIRIRKPDGVYTWIRARATLLPTTEPTIYVQFDVVDVEKAAQAGLVAAHRKQTAVAQLGHEALSGRSVRDLAGRTAQLVTETLEIAYCGVLLDDGHPDALVMMAAAGRFTDQVGSHPHQGASGLAHVLAVSGPLVVDDVRLEPSFEGAARLVEVGIQSLASVSIEPRSAHAGLLVVGAEATAAFAGEDLAFLASVANIIASAIDAAAALEELRHHALHDALTGLPNRVLVGDRLELALEQAAGNQTQVAVLVCDLDRFKVVNDGMGHAAGDDLLRAVAQRLREAVRPGDTVGRFGGDEFVIVCPDVGSLDAVVAIADRIAAAAREPIEVGGTDLVTSVSIGIALGGGTGDQAAAALLRDADAAMYRAKERGRSRYELYDDDMRSVASERLRTETELRRALESGELVLHYQPVLTASTEHVVGLEALVRWRHPERGLLEPAAFVELAGESGLVPELGAWAFREAARQSVVWSAAPSWQGRWIAVNLAPRQLSDRRLLERIDEALADTGADPTLLRIELTEDALIDDDAQSAGFLQGLTDRGIRISVDDFGTGYSSLAYLKRLPLDALKLDRRFVSGLAEDGEDRVIAAAILAMAHALDLQVVAEGVEDPEQLAALQDLGCDLVQGYLLARPLPPEDVPGWLQARG